MSQTSLGRAPVKEIQDRHQGEPVSPKSDREADWREDSGVLTHFLETLRPAIGLKDFDQWPGSISGPAGTSSRPLS
jgi:hypothetical protein